MEAPDRVGRVRAGDRRAIAALARDLDDDRPGARAELQALTAMISAGAESASAAAVSPGASTAPFVVGITGAPGAGKSTLVDALVASWRAEGKRLGVVSVDPSSPIGGGAVLGDRVRMQRHATDDGVFIRSLGTRGAQGGLSRSALDTALLLAAGGFPLVLLETAGVGQAEVEIAAAADVTVLVTGPSLGDSVQTLKSGILELADVLVVNKADLPGADQAARDLRAMLDLRQAAGHGAAADLPILSTVASTGQGVVALAQAIDEARARAGHTSAASAPASAERQRRRAELRIRGLLLARVESVAREALRPGGAAADLAEEVAARRLDPESASQALMARLLQGILKG